MSSSFTRRYEEGGREGGEGGTWREEHGGREGGREGQSLERVVVRGRKGAAREGGRRREGGREEKEKK